MPVRVSYSLAYQASAVQDAMLPMRLLACCLMAVTLVAPVAVVAQTVKMLDAAACSQAPLRIEWTKPKGQLMHLVITDAHTPQKPVTLPVENGGTCTATGRRNQSVKAAVPVL